MNMVKIAAVAIAIAFLGTATIPSSAEAQRYIPVRQDDNAKTNRKIAYAAVGTALAVTAIIILVQNTGDDDEDEPKSQLWSVAPVPFPDGEGGLMPMLAMRFRF